MKAEVYVDQVHKTVAYVKEESELEIITKTERNVGFTYAITAIADLAMKDTDITSDDAVIILKAVSSARDEVAHLIW